MYKILISKDDIAVKETNRPVLGCNDVLVEVVSSFYSVGTESASKANVQLSVLKKAIKYQAQIKNLLSRGDFSTLFKKLNNQLTVESETGYSSFGRVMEYGKNVKTLHKGQYVVCAGPKAIHASLNVVPAGLVFPVSKNMEYAAAPVVSIALNSVMKSKVSPGDSVLIIGAGLLGQFILQIYKSMSICVDIVDKFDANKNISMSNGANVFYTPANFQSCNQEYDVVINTAPILNDDDWRNYLERIKTCGDVILVGAADLNIARSVFYSKRLNFITAYSYGSGRSEYNFENGIDKSTVEYESGPSIDQLIRRSIYLIDNKLVNFESIPFVSLSEDTNLEKVFESKSLGYFFNWEIFDNPMPAFTLDSETPIMALNHLDDVDVYGYSNFFKDSHFPALQALDIPVKNIFTHSPKSSQKTISEKSKSIIISTPHGEHLQCIKNVKTYDAIFVDKPIVSSVNEIDDYLELVSSKMIIGLMARRYSDYIALVNRFVRDTSVRSDLYLQFKFNVETKTCQDRVYFEGGRLIGEMVHHLDLAVYLLGEIEEISVFDFDLCVNKEKRENIVLLLRHRSGAVSNIEYIAKSSPIFDKEFISISTGESSLAIFDFKRCRAKNFIFDEISENDKGVGNMWSLFKEKMDSSDSDYFNELMKHDVYVYKILRRILG